jgi:hypothetical protein
MFNHRSPETASFPDRGDLINNADRTGWALDAEVPGAIGLLILDGSVNPVQHYELGGDFISREELIQSIVADPLLTHGLFGNFDSLDSILCNYLPGDMDVWKDGTFTTREAEKFQRNFWGSGLPLEHADGTLLSSFEAVVSEGAIDDPHDVSHPKRVSLALAYTDIDTHSHPNGTRTQYTVMLPGDSIYIEYLNVDQTLMVDLMRAVFPDADRSAGTLRIA